MSKQKDGEIEQKTCTVKTCNADPKWALWMGDDFSRVRDPHPVREYEDGDIHPFVCSTCRESGVFSRTDMEWVRPEEKLIADGGRDQSGDGVGRSDGEITRYCEGCEAEVTATWDGGVLTCDDCGWVIYK